MENNEWKISFKRGKEKNYVDINSVENFQINNGINFIIGKNNSGKTMVLDSLANGDFELSKKGGKIEPIIINFKYDSIFINNENKPKSRVSNINPIDNFKKEDSKNIDLDYLFNNFKEIISEDLKYFLMDKKLYIKRTYKEVIEGEIAGVELKDSGTGENRILYLLYAMAILGENISSKIKEIENDNEFIFKFIDKISNEFSVEEISKLKLIFDKEHKFFFKNEIELNDFANLISHLISLFEKNFNKDAAKFLYVKIHEYTSSGTRIEVNEENTDLKENNIFRFNNRILLEFYEKWKKYFSIDYFYKSPYLSDEYLKIYREINKTLNIEHLSTDILFLIDEPDAYVNSSMYKTLAETLKIILKQYESLGFDMRIIISTHEERVLKELNSFISNTNLFYKLDNRIHFKNIFNNDIQGFIDSINIDFNEYFIEKYKTDDNCIEDIKKDMNFLDANYLNWFITLKDNLRILMSDSVLIVEGFHDKVALEKMKWYLNVNEIIETDGTYLGMFIWLKIIEYSKSRRANISLLIDLDYSQNKGNVKEHTQLMREYLYKKYTGIIKIYSSLFNDISEWVNYVNVMEQSSLDSTNSATDIEKWYKEENLEKIKLFRIKWHQKIFEKLNNSKGANKKQYPIYDMYKTTNNLLEKEKNNSGVFNSREFSYLFNEKRIFRTIEDYFKHNIDLTNTGENWIKISDGSIYIDEYLGYEYLDYIDKNSFEQWVKLSLNREIDISENSIITNNIDHNKKYTEDGYIFSILDIKNKKLYEISKKDGVNSIYINDNNTLRVTGTLLKTIEIDKIEINIKFDHVYKIHHDNMEDIITDARIFNSNDRDIVKENNDRKTIEYIDPHTKILLENFDLHEKFIKENNIKRLLVKVNIPNHIENMSAFIGPIDMTMDEFEEEFDFEKTWKLLE